LAISPPRSTRSSARSRPNENSTKSSSADLVHELKSTVASVRASADALDAPEADERTKRLARVLRESSGKLEGTVSRFLDLARADAGFPREERESVDVSALATTWSRVFATIALRRRDVRGRRAERSAHLGRRGAARRAAARLLENGASFVPRGGHVRAIVKREDADVVLVVEDDGPGIPEGEREEVFRRYYTTRGHARGSASGSRSFAPSPKPMWHRPGPRARKRRRVRGAVHTGFTRTHLTFHRARLSRSCARPTFGA